MAWEVDVSSPKIIASDLNKYRFYANGILNGEVITGQNASFPDPVPFTYAIPVNGTYNLTVSAVDLVGNESAQSGPAAVVLTTVAPAVPPVPTVIVIRAV